ncbi:MAG: hypothetical protein EOO29_00755 [Comamonadaceae bacterium]|nr:MAG: hypothetical protein EOO29_00755 [Comamonadaceae bacterium]
MFKNHTALSASAHGDLRLSSVFGYDHAAAEAWLPVGLGEAGMVAREYAIVFSSDGDSALPVALTGVVAGRNDYVDPEGQWRARYVPAHVRRYPFIAGQAPAESGARKLVLMFDADAPHFQGAQGLPLFDAAGQPTELVGRVEKVLLDLQQDYTRARKAVKALEAEGLLSVQKLRIQRKGGETHDVSGFRVLDLKKFGELGADALLRLRDCGALMLAHAHLFSLSNLRDGVLSQTLLVLRQAEKPATHMPVGVGLPQDEALNFDGVDWSKLGGDKH